MGSDRKHSYSREEIEVISEQYKIHSMDEMSKILGISKADVRYVFSKYKISKRSKLDPRIDDFDYIYDAYVVKDYSTTKIALNLNCNSDTVTKRLKKFNIKLKEKGHYSSRYRFSEDELTHEYVDLKKSISQIALKYKTSRRFVSKSLDKFGIKKKTMSEIQFDIIDKVRPPELYSEEWLNENYTNKRTSKKDLALRLGVDPDAIDLALKEFGISIRGGSESKIGLMVGEKHPNWKGLADYTTLLDQYMYDYPMKRAKIRDNYTCCLCGSKDKIHSHHMFQTKDIITYLESKYGENLDLSIASDRYSLFELAKCDSVVNDIENLMTVCSHCHKNVIHGKSNKVELKYLLTKEEYFNNRKKEELINVRNI